MNNLKLVPKAQTVGSVFDDFTEAVEFGPALLAAPFTGEKAQLLEVTQIVAAQFASDLMFGQTSPTASEIVSARKKFCVDWWQQLADLGAILDDNDKSLRIALDHRIKAVIDKVAYKIQTGQDLPDTKDKFSHNALKTIRVATQHGDAALLLYRIRYWWPKASIRISGKKWIAKTHIQWAEELGMEPRSFRTAYNHLLKLELIEAMKAKFNGVGINHIRPTPQAEMLFKQGSEDETI